MTKARTFRGGVRAFLLGKLSAFYEGFGRGINSSNVCLTSDKSEDLTRKASAIQVWKSILNSK